MEETYAASKPKPWLGRAISLIPPQKARKFMVTLSGAQDNIKKHEKSTRLKNQAWGRISKHTVFKTMKGKENGPGTDD